MFKRLRNKDTLTPNEVIGIKKEKPVETESLQSLIDLIEAVSDKPGGSFELVLFLPEDDFCIDSSSFCDIRLINNKKDVNKLLIQHKDGFLLHDTYISVDDIYHIELVIKFIDTRSD